MCLCLAFVFRFLSLSLSLLLCWFNDELSFMCEKSPRDWHKSLHNQSVKQLPFPFASLSCIIHPIAPFRFLYVAKKRGKYRKFQVFFFLLCLRSFCAFYCHRLPSGLARPPLPLLLPQLRCAVLNHLPPSASASVAVAVSFAAVTHKSQLSCSFSWQV